jgi:hypothetical protein
MAREKTKVRSVPMPKEAPEGMEFADVKRTVGEQKGAVLHVLVPQANGAGVNAAAKYLSSILPADGPDGAVFCAEAIRNAMVTSQVAQAGGNGTAIAEVGAIVPRIAKLTVVDKGAVAGARLQDFIGEHGRAPSAQEFKEIYAGLTL